MTLDEALATVAGLERYACDTQSEDALIEAGKALRAEVARLTKELAQAQKRPRNGDWWCPMCREALDGSRVTYHERCDTCGTPVTVAGAGLEAELRAEREAHAKTKAMVETWAIRAEAHRQATEAEKLAHAQTRDQYSSAHADWEHETARADRAEAVVRGLRDEATRKGWAEVVWKLDELERA